MRALVIQHDHVSPPGPIGERLTEHGYELVCHVVVEEANFHSPAVYSALPGLDGVDLVVSMGAPWSAYDETLARGWVGEELDLLREADVRGVPVLGICFGGQLLAAAHGGTVEASDRPEIGWVDVRTDEEDLVPAGPWFEWHYDRWTLPPQALEIARNDASSQAFVLRRNLAVQFHPELTTRMLTGWLAAGGDVKVTGAGLDPERLLERTRAEDGAAQARARRLVDAFLARVAGLSRPG